MVGGMISDDSDHEGTLLASRDQDSTGSDTDSVNEESGVGPVTTENVRIPSQARDGQRKGRILVQEIQENFEKTEDERSDGEVTVASTSSAER